jgi:c-di-AMP phosphodiesterase-like protein
LLILADHSIPEISSASGIVSQAQRILVIDHHRRSPQFVDHPMLTYVESQASSTCELVTELLQNTPRHVPIYEAEATIMYLGLLVDTNRFKMHTGARTFETADTLRAWGANIAQTEKSLQEDIEQLQAKAALISSAQVYMDKYMLSISQHPLGRTMLSQTADALLQIKGTDAAFAIAPDAANPDVICVSARSNSSCNVQKIMEKMDGGGHFSAAAAQCPDTSVQAVAAKLKTVLKEEEEHESHSSGER